MFYAAFGADCKSAHCFPGVSGAFNPTGTFHTGRSWNSFHSGVSTVWRCLPDLYLFPLSGKTDKNKTLLLKKVKVPSLGLLDTMIFRMIIAGFLFLTVGLLLGNVMGIFTYHGGPRISLRQLLPLFTWAVYAILLISHSAVGIRGRNSAIW
ncbi:MAG: cytochrome c biogenesis protein CcsA, partial [Deltaproteobacteria bacterium]|nr:cytochrome c biogenesis protein CcsA [Deltaproteobacteria bacterium]